MFYSECQRVLKNTGCLAVYGYRYGYIVDDRATVIMEDFMKHLSSYRAKKVQYVMNNYDDVVLPFSDLERHKFDIEENYSLSHYIGYVSSWASYQKFYDSNPDNPLLEELESKLKSALVGASVVNTQDIQVSVKYPVFLILGRKVNCTSV